jgi:hypothetical protein
MYQDWKHAKEDQRYYGVTVPYDPPQAETPALQASPTTQPLMPIEDLEDFAPEDFMPNVALPRSTDCETLTAQNDLVPAIHRHANKVLREKHLHDVRCPSCGLEFAAEVES